MTSAGIESDPRPSPRLAGALYLVIILGGLFAEGYVRQAALVNGEAAATSRAIADSELLWRAGIAVHAVYLALAVVVNVIIYRLFRSVHATLALTALAASLVALAIEGLTLVMLHVPLELMAAEETLTGVTAEQQQALAYLAVRLFSAGFGIALIFFGTFCLVVGGLILRSRLVPRAIGLLIPLAGTCYVISSLAAILLPELSARLVPWILLPAFAGELSFASWLLVRGAKAWSGRMVPGEA